MKLSNFIKKRRKVTEYVSSRNISIDNGGWATVSIVSEDAEIESKEFKTVKPVDVMTELFSPEIFINLSNINAKIKALKKRMGKLNKSRVDTSDLKKGMIWLNARKKLIGKSKECIMGEFPWKVTTNKLIKKLCEDHDLDSDEINNYQKYIPNEALVEMSTYIDLFEKYTKRQPRMRIILPNRITREVKKEKDPIIIAESPFGNFWFVLGAWDKEVEIMHELWKDILE